MIKINNISEKRLIKEYIDITIDNQDYIVYMCNDVVRGIYKVLEDGTTEDTGSKALCELTGLTMKGFKKLLNEHIADKIEDLMWL